MFDVSDLEQVVLKGAPTLCLVGLLLLIPRKTRRLGLVLALVGFVPFALLFAFYVYLGATVGS